jgi:hypothetical protein
MGAAVADAVHVAPADVRQCLDVPGDVRAEHAQLGGEVVGQVGQVVVVARVQHQHERHPHAAQQGQPPVVVQPDALVASAAGPAVGGVLPVPRRLRDHRRPKPRYPQTVGLEGADVPARHPRQRQPLLLVGRADRVLVELLRRERHATRR